MEFVKVITEDGLNLEGLFEEPENAQKVILHIHGMSGNYWENSFIKTMLKEYPQKDVAFLTVETRGSELLRWFHRPDGKKQLIGNSHEIFEESIYDVEAWMEFLQKRGYTDVYLQGHSLGCAKVVYYQKTKKSPLVKSLLLISPSDMKGLLLNDDDVKEYKKFKAEAEQLVKDGKENELLSEIHWGFARQSAKSYLNFAEENQNLSIFNYFDPSLGFDIVASLTIPVLSFLGTKDTGIVSDAYEATEMLKKHISSFKGIVFDGAEHDFYGFEKQITDAVLEFIK